MHDTSVLANLCDIRAKGSKCLSLVNAVSVVKLLMTRKWASRNSVGLEHIEGQTGCFGIRIVLVYTVMNGDSSCTTRP